MPRLIKDRELVTDAWQILQSGDVLPSDGDVIVPLGVWREQSAILVDRRGSTGVWLSPADNPADIGTLPSMIAVQFPEFTDGRGYSTARLLRQRLGFAGELRAFGDVQRDQLYELTRCGFNSFVLRGDQDLEDALTAFNEFSETYQADAERGPLFDRRFSRQESKAAEELADPERNAA